jgi:N-acetylglucosamine repressor
VRLINLKKANVARADTIRHINRQIVLNYVREKEPISRAEISYETALRRPTVSLIVEELKARGLIDEIEGESTGGRPPQLLRLRAGEPIAIGVDLGITETVVATGDLIGRILKRESFATNPNLEATFGKIQECVHGFLNSEPGIEAIGISVPGLVDPETGEAIFVPYFKWRDWPVAAQLHAATGRTVLVDNDANAAALAELWLVRPEIMDARDFIFVMVEEGLGTGIVFDGQIYHGRSGGAGEFGHMTIARDAPVACAAGSYECWEAFASERAALARYASASSEALSPAITFEQLIDRALQKEKVAEDALLETAHYLGVGISNLLKGLNPEAVIVGGLIARAWPLIAEELNDTVVRNSMGRGLESARVIPSTLGVNTRLLGALSLVLARKFTTVLTG